jgi:hypothetical protein
MCDSGRAVEKKVACVKVTRPDLDDGRRSCIYPIQEFSAVDEFEDAEPGEKVVLEYVEMDQAELDALPEFEGW